MANNVYIDSEQIKNIGNSLLEKSLKIYMAYRGECTPAITAGADCIQLTGVDINEMNAKLDEIYKNLQNNIQALARFLINNVAATYDIVMDSIRNNFNNELGQALANIMGMNAILPPTPNTHPENDSGIIDDSAGTSDNENLASTTEPGNIGDTSSGLGADESTQVSNGGNESSVAPDNGTGSATPSTEATVEPTSNGIASEPQNQYQTQSEATSNVVNPTKVIKPNLTNQTPINDGRSPMVQFEPTYVGAETTTLNSSASSTMAYPSASAVTPTSGTSGFTSAGSGGFSTVDYSSVGGGVYIR
ncbi:MAG: hypothetical protein IJO63_02575 [Bacilli bacterium]|nr:hypothetical protein [Bacilli bacterium]